MLTIDLIAGARPNFVKIAPIIHAITKARGAGANIRFRLIHTGQHYDKNMSDTFFQELNIPHPDANLGAGGGTQVEQTAAIMVGYEKLLLEQGKSDVCLVVGDVTSTMACSITAKKLQMTVVHVEAGIRSGDWTMPEEINRLVTDAITDHYYTTSEIANGHLRKAGVGEDRIHFVGNTMIDTLLANRIRFTVPSFWNDLALEPKQYIVLTFHRPSNVDQPKSLKALLDEIIAHSESVSLVFPVHPRTRRIVEALSYTHPRLHLVDPMGYLTFNYLVEHAKAVITDSGGITEETTVMDVPCITIRDNTERPETITIGSNELIGTDPKAIAPVLSRLFAGQWKKGGIPPLWDGKTSDRIVKKLLELNSYI